MNLSFSKFHGAGNDFILIDNRNNSTRLSALQIGQLCHRRFGIGADGLIMLNPGRDDFSFVMDFYNSDGLKSCMCGNGGRCLAAFADSLGITSLHFLASDGPHTARILSHYANDWSVELQIKEVDQITDYAANSYIVDTGAPHLVVFVEDLSATDVFAEGNFWRHHKDFAPDGLNVNFVQITGNGKFSIRTFERGVEAETWACGTGSTAAAIAARRFTKSDRTHWDIKARGGRLSVDYTVEGSICRQVMLTGPARLVFEGVAEI